MKSATGIHRHLLTPNDVVTQGPRVGVVALVFALVSGSMFLFFLSSVSDAPAFRDQGDEGTAQVSQVHTLPGQDGWFIEDDGSYGNEAIYLAHSTENVAFLESSVLLMVQTQENADVLRLDFEGANPVIPEGLGKLAHTSNYFHGNDSSCWQTGIRNYRELLYKGLYDGIDLHYSSTARGLKSEFVVSPGADPGAIRVHYHGARSLLLDDEGNLCIWTGAGVVTEERPCSYQVVDGERREIPTSYRLEEELLSFSLGTYDAKLPLIIDPLVVSSYVGGGDGDLGLAVALDSDNNVYVAGHTKSGNFPTTPGCFDDQKNASNDIVVFKMTPDCKELLFSTLVGGDAPEYGVSIAVDQGNNVYVTGDTRSSDFPTSEGCFDDSYNGGGNEAGDVFVFKLSPDGSKLLYSTFIGGEGEDRGTGIALDDYNNSYLTGHTNSTDFPTTPGCFDDSLGGNDQPDTFVMKLDQNGSELVYSSFVGGLDDEGGIGVAVDAGGVAHVTGTTRSPDFPTTQNCFDEAHNGDYDMFVFGMNANGSWLVYSSFVGGGGEDRADGIALDSLGRACVVGYTLSQDFPTTTGAYDGAHNGKMDVVSFKLDSDGTILLYSTFIGGSEDDYGKGIAVDARDNVYVAGYSFSPDFPLEPGAGEAIRGELRDIFLTTLDSGGSSLSYSSLVGGSDMDFGWDVAVGSNGRAYVAGTSDSDDIPITADCYDESFNGVQDVLVLGFEFNLRPTATIDSVTPNPGKPGNTVFFYGNGSDGDGMVVAYEWYSSIDGYLSGQRAFNSSSLEEGRHLISFRVKDNNGSWSEEEQLVLQVADEGRDGFLGFSQPGTVVAALALVACALLLLFVVATELGRYWLQMLLLPLYTRLKKEDVLSHELRGRIYQIIVSNPGIHLRAILEEYQKDNIPPLHISSLVYHLDVLTRNRFIRSVSDGYRKRFYMRGHPVEKSLSELILARVREYHTAHQQGITKRELAASFGVSEKVIGTNLEKLSDKVYAKREKRFLRYYPLTGQEDNRL